MDGNVILVTEVKSSFMDYDVQTTYKDSTIQKGQSHKFSKEMFILVLKSEHSICFPWPVKQASTYIIILLNKKAYILKILHQFYTKFYITFFLLICNLFFHLMKQTEGVEQQRCST